MKRSPAFNVVVFAAKESVSYLDCVLDSHMSGMGHAEKVLTKVNQSTSKFLDKKAMVTLALALAQPYFDNACCSWYNGLTLYLKNTSQV